MTVPVLMLLGFASWTVLLLLFTVGVYRWSRILTGRAELSEFKADQVEGEDWYKRALRAHANCIENLPVFGAIVFALHVSAVSGPLINSLCAVVLLARVMQSLIHVGLTPSNGVVLVRFSFFITQLVCFLWLAALVVVRGGVFA